METINLSLSDGEDKISDLPDNLIHHIFSFLDITYAIEASVLSRRWRYLWKSLPTLNINDLLHPFYTTEKEDEYTTEEVNDFVYFVDSVLDLRESSDILRFNLACKMVDDDVMDPHIHRWILAAVRHNVQELRFSRSIYGYTFEIPDRLFSCKSLTKLEIVIYINSNYDYKVGLPSSMSLPRLKYLRIQFLPFDDERLTNMLFSSCPVLESLILESCRIHNVNLNISSSTLKHFKFSCYLEDYDTKVKLNAPNLTSISFTSHLSKDHSLENLSSLVTAYIDLSVDKEDQAPGTYEQLLKEKKELYAQRMVKFLRALHNVKVLTLSPWTLQVVSRAPEVLDTQFLNLQRLKLRTFLSRTCMDSIIHLLNSSPNLESLSLRIAVKHSSDEPPMYPFCDEINFNSGNTEVDYWEAGLSSSPCMLYHLKSVEIRDLRGCVNELKFLEIILKHALVLEKVVLFSWTCQKYKRDRERRMMKFSDKLLSFPRASSSVRILFEF